MHTNKIRLIIFDWDGTLIDSVARIVDAMQHALADVAVSRTAEQIRTIIGLGLPETMQILVPEIATEQHSQIITSYRFYYASTMGVPSNLFPGARDVITQLKQRGYMLAIATAKSREGLDYTLNYLELKDKFHTTRCVGEVPSKPHPEMLLQIMAELQVPAEETIMIGDTAHDIQMATNAGVQALAVCYGAHGREQLLSQNPLACINNIKEIPAWLESFVISS